MAVQRLLSSVSRPLDKSSEGPLGYVRLSWYAFPLRSVLLRKVKPKRREMQHLKFILRLAKAKVRGHGNTGKVVATWNFVCPSIRSFDRPTGCGRSPCPWHGRLRLSRRKRRSALRSLIGEKVADPSWCFRFWLRIALLPTRDRNLQKFKNNFTPFSVRITAKGRIHFTRWRTGRMFIHAEVIRARFANL